jgi:DNA-binding NarL/FixJ family response regulator
MAHGGAGIGYATEILQMMAEHLTNPEIVARLGLTPKTIRNNVSNIFAKLQVADRAQAII